MRKLQTHEIERTCETSERRSYRAFSLPYSVGLNLMEKAFSRIMGLLREPEARTVKPLESMAEVVSAVMARDVRGFRPV